MKTIVIDDNAHQILLDWKNCIEDEEEKLKISSNPTHSQAIRWASEHIKLLNEQLCSYMEQKKKKGKK